MAAKTICAGAAAFAVGASYYLLRRFVHKLFSTPRCKMHYHSRFVAGGVCTSKAVLTGKTVIVSGSNTGIGKETALELARRNARVILACRNPTKGEAAAKQIRQLTGNSKVEFKEVDLASLSSIRRFADRVLEEEERVDIVVNNAAMFAFTHVKTQDGNEMQFAVNYLGHFLLTSLLLNRLKQAPCARVVNIASFGYKSCTGINFDDVNMDRQKYSPMKAYTQSKLAMVLFTRELAKRLRGTSVTSNCLHPGVVLNDNAWNSMNIVLKVSFLPPSI